MSNGLIDLEDEMYRLYLTFFPKGKAVKTGFDALPSKIVNLISQYHLAAQQRQGDSCPTCIVPHEKQSIVAKAANSVRPSNHHPLQLNTSPA